MALVPKEIKNLTDHTLYARDFLQFNGDFVTLPPGATLNLLTIAADEDIVRSQWLRDQVTAGLIQTISTFDEQTTHATIPSQVTASSDLTDVEGAVNVALGLTKLDALGKLPNSVIPALAISDVWTVADEAARLVLTAQKGDFAVQTDTNLAYILSVEPATSAGNWVAFHPAPLSSDFSNGGEAGGADRLMGNTDAFAFGLATSGTERLRVEADGQVTLSGQIKIQGGTPGLGSLLTSDADGLASWTAAPNPNATKYFSAAGAFQNLNIYGAGNTDGIWMGYYTFGIQVGNAKSCEFFSSYIKPWRDLRSRSTTLAYSWDVDTDTGLRHGANSNSDSFALVAGGVTKLTINSTGVQAIGTISASQNISTPRFIGSSLGTAINPTLTIISGLWESGFYQTGTNSNQGLQMTAANSNVGSFYPQLIQLHRNTNITQGTLTVSSGNMVLTAPTIPASATAGGVTGQMAWDSGFMYVCTVGGAEGAATWVRSALSTWV